MNDPTDQQRARERLAKECLNEAKALEKRAKNDRETGDSIQEAIDNDQGVTPDEPQDVAAGLINDADSAETTAKLLRRAHAALRAAPEAVALRTAMTTLEQIASAPDDQGAKFNAMGALRFLQTQPVELRAAPEGFVLVPEVMDLDMEVAFCEVWFSKRRCIDDPEMQDAWAAALAARPQGVKE